MTTFPNQDPAAFRYIGQPRRTREDPRFVTGRGRYVADIALPGMKHVAIVAIIAVVGYFSLYALDNHLRARKVRAQGGQQTGCRHAAHGKLLRPVQKAAPVNRAVHVGVKQNQQFLVKVLGSLKWHGGHLME